MADNKEAAKAKKNEGNAHFKTGNLEGALQAYEEAIALDAKDVFLYTNKALCLYKLGRQEEALEVCLQAKSVDASQSKIYYREGLVYTALGNLIYAAKSFKTCFELQNSAKEAAALRNEVIQEIIKEVRQLDEPAQDDLSQFTALQDK